MKNLKTLIVDDEEESRKLLKITIEDNHPELNVIGEAASALEAIKEINCLNPDLVFLDIQMPNGTGFDVLEALPDRSFDVVMLTAHSDYAIRAIRADVCDYLVKPLDPIDLENAVERIFKIRNTKKRKAQDKNVLAISTREGVILLNPDEITRFQGDGSYTHVFKQNGEKLLVSQNLKSLSLYLDETFMRVHNSHIIRIDQAQKILKDEGIICMADGSQVPLARRKRKDFLDLFNQV